uniref:PH-like domain-containing protein n=1 Tax=Tetranychus urticae TaxID=32264 RepID=T1JWL9_TETUR
MTVKDPLKQVYFNVEVIQLNCEQVKSNVDSFISDLTSIFTHEIIKSCCIIHPSGVEYHLIGQSEGNKSQKVIPVLGNGVAPVKWKGYVELQRHNLRQNWIYLVRRLCFFHSRKLSYCAVWRFDEDPNFVQLIRVDRNIKLNETSFPLSIYGFGLGNIINGNRFMIHFGCLWNKPPIITTNDDKNSEISIEDIKIKHNYNKKKFVLKFNTKTTTNESIGPDVAKCRLVYDYKSIKRVLICLSKVGLISLYLQLLYPPRIFVKAPKKKSGVLKRIRRCNCGSKLSSDVIGKSDVLRLVFDIEDDSVITSIYRWQKYHHFDICYGSLIESYMKPLKPEYPKSFPLSVNYALSCIYSIGYHFLDDLKKNHGGVEVLNEIILKYIKANKEELIVEALHRLFDAYLVGKVYNAIEHLKSLLKRIESKWTNDKDSSESKINYQSWTIITPTRTIFTPPITYDTSMYMTDHLIRVIVRDENIDLSILLDKNMHYILDDQIPYRERSKTNDKFLSFVIGKKLLDLGCLSVAGHSYELPKIKKIFPNEFKNGHRILIKSAD